MGLCLDPTVLLSAPTTLGLHNLLFKLPPDQTEHAQRGLKASLITACFLEQLDHQIVLRDVKPHFPLWVLSAQLA